MCRIIIHKSTLNFNHSFFYNNVSWSRFLPDLLKIPESQITMVVIVLIACVCSGSVRGEGGTVPTSGWLGGGGGHVPLVPPASATYVPCVYVVSL